MFETYEELVKEGIAELNGGTFVEDEIEAGNEDLMKQVAFYLKLNEYSKDVEFDDKDEDGKYRFDPYAQRIMMMYDVLRVVRDEFGTV